MNKWLITLIMILSAIGASACAPDNTPDIDNLPEQPGDSDGNNPDQEGDEDMIILIRIDDQEFTASLADNATSEGFRTLLPMRVEMTEYGGNEKYYDLPRTLPAAATNPGTINTGDIMLYGARTLVLFYKTFSTSYTYTKIGRVDNPSGLEMALGAGNVTVTFEQAAAEV